MTSSKSNKDEGNRFALLSLNLDDMEDANNVPYTSIQMLEENPESISNIGNNEFSDPVITVNEILVDQSDKTNIMTPNIQSLTNIRKTYNTLIKNHRNIFTNQLMDQLWESWISVMPEFPTTYDGKMTTIRRFIINPDQTELILHDCSSRHRYEYHQICSLLKLEHKSIGLENKQYKTPRPEKNDVKKTLILTKPDNWCWEFTDVSMEQKQIDELKMKERVQKHREWVKVMKTKRCSCCTVSASESQLFRTKTLDGLYCETCILLEKFMGLGFKHAYGRPF
jgi:hypothetical protein